MWFSNLICYRFKQDVSYTQEDFDKALEQDLFRPCGSQDLSTFGWTKAFGKHGDTLAHFSQKCILVCAKREEKVLPASVINDMVAEKIEQIEAEENRPVKKKEKDELKENILHSLLPQALKNRACSLLLSTKKTVGSWSIAAVLIKLKSYWRYFVNH